MRVKETLLRNLVRPLIERLGTMIAAYLIATGADSDLVAQLANGLAAMLFLLVDFVSSRFFREREIARLLGGGSQWPFGQDGER